MKPDKFDEAIRQKLEGIQPSFQEEDWAKFKAYQTTHVPNSFSFIKQYGRSLMYSAASVAAAVMVFANVYKYIKNQHLEQQLEQLKGKLAQKNDTPVRISNRVDTVYITKYIQVEPTQINQYDSSVPQNEVSPSGLTTDDKQQEVAESLRKVGKIIRQNPDERISEVFERQAADNEIVTPKASDTSVEVTSESQEINPIKNPISSKTKSNITTKETMGKSAGLSPNLKKGNDQESFGNNSNKLQKQQQFAVNETNSSSPNPPTMGEMASTSTDNSVEIMSLEPNTTLSELDGLQPNEAKVQRYAYAQAAVAAATKTESKKSTASAPPISLKNMKLRMGMGLNIGDKYTGYSVNSSLLLGKFWSIDVGLSRANINGPQYYTEDIFKAKTQKDFQTWQKEKGDIKPPLALPQAFDIKTSVNLLRIPISLTYRWPIKDGFTVLTSGGTNLNLSANQKYSFYKKERNGEVEEVEGQFNIKPSLSNDLIIAAGVEKQWRHLVVQAETYAAPYLQKPTYLTENRNIGVRVRILYSFGRKQI